MKLHLPKMMLVAVLGAFSCTAVYAEEVVETTPDTTEEEIIYPDIEDVVSYTDSTYLNVGQATKVNSFYDNLVSKNASMTVGDGDLVGYFTEVGNPDTFVREFSATSTSSAPGSPVSNSLVLGQHGSFLGVHYVKNLKDLTIQGSGQVYLGGKIGSNQFAGLVAKNVTLDSTASGTQEAGKANLWADALYAEKLTINGGSAYIRTIEGGGNSTTGCGYTLGSTYIDSAKSATITSGLYINNGYLEMGRQSNGNTVGAGNRNETDAHFVNVISGELKQTDGTAKLLGKTYLNVSKVEQDKGTMTLAADPTNGYEYLRFGNATTTISQTGAGTLNVEGKIIYGSSGNGNMKLTVQQTGNGSISLDNGVMFTTKSADTASLIDQQADGTISLGGDYTSATFNISQSGSGTITLKNGAAVNANTVKLTDDNVTDTSKTQGGLVVEKGATLTADSITIDGGKLENKGTVKGDIHIGAVAATFSLRSTDAGVTTGELVNSGTIDGAITMSGGTLVLEEGSAVAGLSATGGDIQVNGDVTMTGNLEVNGDADLIFADTDTTIDLGAYDLTIGEGANIAVTLTNDDLASVSGIKLFSGADTDYTGYDVTLQNTSGETIGSAVLSNSSNGDVTITVVPEPTTTTLSLLALVALASRRRRK